MAYDPVFREWRVGVGDPVAETKNAEEKFWVEKTYSTYEENVSWWEFLDQAYMGGRRWAKAGHLYKFILEATHGKTGAEGRTSVDPKEAPEYAHRKEQAWRINLVAEWVDSHVAFLSSQDPKRPKMESLGDLMTQWSKSVDAGRSLTLTDFTLQEAVRLLYRGTIYVGTDLPVTLPEIQAFLASAGLAQLEAESTGGITLDLDKAAALELLPYTWALHPENVLQAKEDAAGNFREILYKEVVDSGVSLRPEEGQTSQTKPGTKTQYRFISQTEWAVYEIKDKGESSGARELIRTAHGPNQLGIVPIRREVYKDSEDPMCGLSAVEDWVGVDRSNFNISNALTHHLKEGSASQRTLNTKLPPAADTEAREEAETAALRAASSSVLLMGPDDKAGVLNVNFPAAALMLDFMREIPDMMMMLTGFRDKQRTSAVAQSGVALMRAFRELNARLARIAGILQRMERFQCRVAASLVAGDGKLLKEAPEGVSEWPKNFDVAAAEDILQILEKVKDTAAPEVTNALIVDLLRRVFAHMAEGDLEKLVKAQEGHQPQTAAQEMDSLALEAGLKDQAPKFPAGEEDDFGPPQ